MEWPEEIRGAAWLSAEGNLGAGSQIITLTTQHPGNTRGRFCVAGRRNASERMIEDNSWLQNTGIWSNEEEEVLARQSNVLFKDVSAGMAEELGREDNDGRNWPEHAGWDDRQEIKDLRGILTLRWINETVSQENPGPTGCLIYPKNTASWTDK